GLAMVAPHAWIVAALGLGLLGLAALLAKRLGLLAAIPVGLGGLALLAGALEPDLVRNLAGFARNLWTSPERLHHRYYGDTGEPIPGKYWTVLAEGMPGVVLLAFVAGLPLFAVRS